MRNSRSHMSTRRAQGVTYRTLAKEFGVAPSTAHRTVMRAKTDTDQAAAQRGEALRLSPDMLRRGYVKLKEKP